MLESDSLKINLKKLLKKSMTGFREIDESENAVMGCFTSNVSRDVFHQLTELGRKT